MHQNISAFFCRVVVALDCLFYLTCDIRIDIMWRYMQKELKRGYMHFKSGHPIHNKFLSRRLLGANCSLTQQKNIFTSSNLPSFSPQKLLRCLSTLFGKEDDLLRSAVLQYYVWVFYTIDTVRQTVICCVGLLRVFKSNKMTTY